MAVLIVKHDEPQEIFVCDCGMLEHSLSFLYLSPDSSNEVPTTYVEAFLYPYRSCIHRTVIAIKYLLGWEPKYGLFDSISFRGKDMDRLIKLLECQVGTDSIATDKNTVSLYSDFYELRFVQAILNFQGDISPEFSVEFYFKQMSYLRRIWRCFRYVLGYRSRYKHTDCFEMHPDQAKILKVLAQRHQEIYNSGT